jgi:hypothetical protein
MTVKAHSQVRGLLRMQIWTNKSKAAGTNDYVDYGIRMAHAFSQKPQKLTLPICAGTDWYAQLRRQNERW